MKVLAFDLSTKTGWALFENGKLVCYGQLKASVEGDKTSDNYPHNFIKMASKMAYDVKGKIINSKPNYVVTEETNKGKNRFSQKQLEFIHFAVNHVAQCKIHYMDTSEWRMLVGISLDKDQRKGNRKINEDRKAEFTRCLAVCASHDQLNYSIALSKCLNKRDRNKVTKEFNAKYTQEAKAMMKSYRYKEEGKVKGKIDVKQLSVNHVNQKFFLQLKKKDNDIADAICIGEAFIKKFESKISKEIN